MPVSAADRHFLLSPLLGSNNYAIRKTNITLSRIHPIAVKKLSVESVVIIKRVAMPEGPEIRIAADNIAKIIEGQIIDDIDVGLAHLCKGARRLKGHKVERVETQGKAMLIHFANQFSIYSHNQLYGVWKTSQRGVLPDTKRSLRLALHTKASSALLYSASDIGIYETHRLIEHPFLSKIGPDILQPTMSWQTLSERLSSKRFRNRSLSSLYLDQHFIAGIGNYLRSEILFAAGLHPDFKPKQLSVRQIEDLATQSLNVSKRAYETKGYTVPDDLFEQLLVTDSDYENVRFMVFNRHQLPCRHCVHPITKAQRNGRRIYWCEHCQRPPR